MTPFALIRSLARAGATKRAWALFEAGGHAARPDDSDALTLKGRLLKDRARLAAGRERARLYADSGEAYAAAAALAPATYPLINAATVALLGGKPGRARTLARKTLALLDSGSVEGETPYWIAATRAEALLIMGKAVEARAALADAMTRAPEAWEDHASTLRQFALILAERQEDASWLDRYRPPPSLHFSGIMGIAPDDEKAAADIEAAVLAVKPGFGFGALAAGADIIIAEALVRQGGRLHVVLPCAAGAFRAQSVVRLGEAWGPRFDALMAAADSVETLDEPDTLSQAAIALADEMAMGLALRQARMIESGAVALRVRDRMSQDSAQPQADLLWQRDGQRLRSLAVHRAVAPLELAQTQPLRNIALVAVAGGAGEAARFPADWTIERAGYVIMGFTDPAAAAAAAQVMAAALDGAVRIGLDYTPLDPAGVNREPFDRLLLMADNAHRGLPVATRPLALALSLHAPQFHCEPAGEIKAGVGDIPYWNVWASKP